MAVPNAINWRITALCNMGCRFCYGPISSKRSPSLLPYQKEAVVKKIASSGVRKLTLTGGEPLIDQGIYGTIAQANERGVFVSLHTNGILLDEEGLDKLEGKVGRISLALDGSNEEVQYGMRQRKGYFDHVVDLMGKIRERGIPFSVKTVVGKPNLHDISNMATLLQEYSPDFWLVSQFLPKHRGARNRGTFEITDEEYQALDLSDVSFAILRTQEQGGSLPFFFINPDGTVCTQSPTEDVVVGSILNSEISDLWEIITDLNQPDRFYHENIGKTN
jgi:MoaA/NifB/PqqE/SkfB family radical SAM enzyme